MLCNLTSHNQSSTESEEDYLSETNCTMLTSTNAGTMSHECTDSLMSNSCRINLNESSEKQMNDAPFELEEEQYDKELENELPNAMACQKLQGVVKMLTLLDV